MGNFADVLTFLFSTFLFVAYLFIVFFIVSDLFRDDKLGGFAKVLWLIGLVFVPYLTAIVYILTRGDGMAKRQQAVMQRMRDQADAHIRNVAGSPASHIAEAKALLDAGTITPEEFAKLKAKALG
jgi:ABC-type multidrug transport system fused ATPase/permease subunit